VGPVAAATQPGRRRPHCRAIEITPLQALDQLRSRGATAAAIPTDVRDPAQVEMLFDAAERALGRLHALVVTAGITGRSSTLAEAPLDVIRDTIELNVLGSLYCAREAVRRMATSRGGRGGAIVLVSSGAATIGSPGEFVWYAASKGAIDSLTLGLSKEVARDGVRVNAVAPGLVDTELHARSTGEPGRVDRMLPVIPFGRAAAPEEIAEPILWLLSDAASYVSGAIVRAAGGR
jgi:NAD(P)-dependent dehydrogenase (short-subunit alcohol dehydrogenase family)